jgi:hypothetical protein
MAELTVKLGSIALTDLEVPEKIPFGVEQMLVVHKEIGGSRTVDAMGTDYPPIDWSGWILGPNALARAQSLVAMVAAGLPVTLTWSGLSYQVIVRSFLPVMERVYQIPYHIVCEVVSNNVQPNTKSTTPPIDQAVIADNVTANTLTQSIDDPDLNVHMANVTSGIQAA